MEIFIPQKQMILVQHSNYQLTKECLVSWSVIDTHTSLPYVARCLGLHTTFRFHAISACELFLPPKPQDGGRVNLSLRVRDWRGCPYSGKKKWETSGKKWKDKSEGVGKDELPRLYPLVHTPSTQTSGVTPHSGLIHCWHRATSLYDSATMNYIEIYQTVA
jgi:hypothetical protein